MADLKQIRYQHPDLSYTDASHAVAQAEKQSGEQFSPRKGEPAIPRVVQYAERGKRGQELSLQSS